MSEELKQCPFCGAFPVRTIDHRISSLMVEYSCSRDGHFVAVHGATEDEARGRWNRRANEERD